MQKFTVHKGLVAPAGPRERRHRRDHPEAVPEVDPARPASARTCSTSGATWTAASRARTTAARKPNPDFVLNQPRYAGRVDPAGAQELRLRLVARARAVGAGPVRLPRHHRAELRRHLLQQQLQERPAADRAARSAGRPAVRRDHRLPGLQPDRSTSSARWSSSRTAANFAFDVQAFRKYCLLNGLDDIGLTLRHKDKIKAFEAERLATKPWLAHPCSTA